MTRDLADRLARDLALRAEGDGDRLLERVAALDPEDALAVRARLVELGAASLARTSLAQPAAG